MELPEEALQTVDAGSTTAGRADRHNRQTGLTVAEVHARVLAGQVNVAPPLPGRTVGQILRANVFTRFNAILGSLLVVVAIVGPVQDGLFGVVLVANTTIGVLQEIRAKRLLDRLAILSAPRAHVVREGRVQDLPVEQIVLDDVLELRPGDQVVVDGSVLASERMELDESLITGEADSVERGRGDRVLSGSFVVAGTGTIRATGVGEAAYASSVEAQARRFSLIRSELQSGTNRILRWVTWVMVPSGIALVVTQLMRSHQSLHDALRSSVAGVSAMVPEGLVLLTSIAFAVGALRLAQRHVLVQELAAVEGLARVDVLCIDKTGTLTEAGMHLETIEVLADMSRESVEQILATIAVSDPAPNATIRALQVSNAPEPRWTVESRVPFSSSRKWSAARFVEHGTWILGAADVILPKAQHRIEFLIARYEESAHRVLLLARTGGSISGPDLPEEMEPIALVVLAERLRADAAETVRYLVGQGITIKVLSGDAPETVAKVAQRVGVPTGGDPRDARELIDDEDLGRALDATNVLGRVRPEQKLAAVRILQSAGHIVAMVGDGVNDVQALKQADLGIAMGSGSQSSRSVARVILLDSAFSAVPRMLAEGRRVIANIERVANLFVTKTVYAALLAVVVAIAAVPYPFFPRHLTIVSTFTIGIPGFFLALAGGAPRAVSGFAKRVLAFTLPAGIAAAAATLAVYSVARASSGTTLIEARTSALIAVFAVAIWVLLQIARPLSFPRILLVIAMTGGLALPLTFSYGRKVFALQVPSTGLLALSIGVVGVSIAMLTVWRACQMHRARTNGNLVTPSNE
jgi:cation-transporting ATPase E